MDAFSDVTEQKRAEQRLRVQHAITAVVAEATTLKEAASQILETICEPLGWNLGILWIVGPTKALLPVRGQRAALSIPLNRDTLGH